MVFLVIGNDKRQTYIAQMLRDKGDPVILGEEYRNQLVDVILLPVGNSSQLQERILKLLRPGQKIFGSHFKTEFREYCISHEIALIDYMAGAGVAHRNAVSVAEGAIAEAMKLGKYTIQGSRCLIAGYGVCGQKLGEKLQSWKAKVTVLEKDACRRMVAAADGCVLARPDFGQIDLRNMDYIFNTVPEVIFGRDQVDRICKDTVIIDLASVPGGFDMDYCRQAGIHVEKTPGLPGKYGAATAAEILVHVVRSECSPFK